MQKDIRFLITNLINTLTSSPLCKGYPQFTSALIEGLHCVFKWYISSPLAIAMCCNCCDVFLSLESRFDDTELNELLDDLKTHINYQY